MSKVFFTIITLAVIGFVYCDEPSQNTAQPIDEDIRRFSEVSGYQFAEELSKGTAFIDLDSVIEGIRAYSTGKKLDQVMSNRRDQYLAIESRLFNLDAENNLKSANEFLKNLRGSREACPSLEAANLDGLDRMICKEANGKTLGDEQNSPDGLSGEAVSTGIAKHPGLETKPIHVLENGKLIYEVIKEGQGSSIIQKGRPFLAHYRISTLAGKEIVNTFTEESPRKISLTEVIAGFRIGVQGMRVGEQRKVFIHPDLAYKTFGHVPPNSLLVVEVEVTDML